MVLRHDSFWHDFVTKINKTSRVLVFCSANQGVAPAFFSEIKLLGNLIGKSGMELVYGGARVGLMGELANACLNAGGRVVGVIPEYLNKTGIVHEGLTELVVVSNLLDRKRKMLELSDVAVASPGGIGTIDEITELLALKQLNEHKKPIIFHNFLDFWDPLLEFFQELELRGMISQSLDTMLLRAVSANEVLDMARKAIQEGTKDLN